MPAALTAAKTGAGSGPEEESKGPSAGSQPADIAGPKDLATPSSDFSPLQDLDAAVALHDPFSHLKVASEAESSNQASRANQADCLRFSPALSSDHVVITDNGLTTYATQQVGNGEMGSNAVIGTYGFSEGVHYWEIICPIFCNSIDFGVTYNPKKVTKANTISE